MKDWRAKFEVSEGIDNSLKQPHPAKAETRWIFTRMKLRSLILLSCYPEKRKSYVVARLEYAWQGSKGLRSAVTRQGNRHHISDATTTDSDTDWDDLGRDWDDRHEVNISLLWSNYLPGSKYSQHWVDGFSGQSGYSDRNPVGVDGPPTLIHNR